MNPRPLFSEEESRPKPKVRSLFDSVTPIEKYSSVQIKTKVPEYYDKHELLKDKSDEFKLKVASVDRSMDLKTIEDIDAYGISFQTKVSDVLKEGNEVMTSIHHTSFLSGIKDLLRILNEATLESFKERKIKGVLWDKTTYPTISEYTSETNDLLVMIDKCFSELTSRLNEMLAKFAIIETQKKNLKALEEEVDCYILTGLMVLDRAKKKMFVEHDQDLLIEQFEKKLYSLNSYRLVTFGMYFQTLDNVLNMSSVMEQNYETFRLSIDTYKNQRMNTLTDWSTKMLSPTTTVKDAIASLS